MKTIVAFADNYVHNCRAGAEMSLHQILKALVLKGYRVVVCTKNVTTVDEVDGVLLVEHFDDLPLHAGIVITQLIATEKAYSYARTVGAKFIQILHNDNNQTIRNIQLNTDMFVCNAHWLKEKLNPPAKTVVCHPYVDPTKYQVSYGSKVTLVNLAEIKGGVLFAHLARKMPDVEFLGVMGGYDDQIIPRFPNVEIQPNTSDMVNDVWSKTAVLLMPSRIETFGMVAVEAIYSGIQVIANKTNGLLESAGDCAIYVPLNRPDLWRKAIREALTIKARDSIARRASELKNENHLSQLIDSIEELLC